MTEKNRCPYCHTYLPADAPRGICPQCLLKVGMVGNPDITVDGHPVVEGPGTKIGRYELLELLGEGGMGLVYLAQQKEPVKRKVAFKIVKLGMDTKQVVARFEAERQTLALLEHPNIAHVFDAGTTDSGRPYFVMEYVKGKSITRYCDEKKLGIEKRLELFQKVCEGIHHAHQKGIIHRDIKPSNILVSIQDDKPVPKIIDFGIAKAITQPLTEKTSYTEHGQLLGTPEYMSPEQAEMAYQDIDTRSDIYSLGVLLYELLTGATPFDTKRLREGGIDHIQQVICQEEPRTPSARLTSLGDKAKAVAERRRTQIITLTRRLHKELEWIPMKAIRKDRTRRYRSASELADDIQNYLTGTPLIAGPESTIYRARKFVRKHAGSVATAALVSLAVIIGLLVSIAMGQRAEQARKQEAAARVEAEQARDKEAALRAQVEQALARAEEAERIAQEQRELAEERAETYRRAMYANNLAMAKEAINKGDINRAKKLLNACDPDLRGWEWQHLDYMSADPCIKTLSGHEDCVYAIAVSPDGRRIASGSGDETVKIWDTVTGSEVITLRGLRDDIGCVAFSPDGTRIAACCDAGFTKIWDIESGAEVRTLRGHRGVISSVAFSPNGRYLASSGARDRTIKVWDIENGTVVKTLRGLKGYIGRVVFSPDGKLIVDEDDTITMWDAVTGAEIRTLTGHDNLVRAITVSPDGSYIASGSDDKTIKIWDAVTGAEIKTLIGHNGGIVSVAFSPDGKRIASCGNDYAIKIWNANTGQEERSLRGHRIRGIVFSRDGKQIISGSLDETIKIWDPAINRQVLRSYGGTEIRQVAFSPDGKRIAACTKRGRIVLIDALSGVDILSLRGHSFTWGPLPVTFSPDGSRFASGGMDKRINIWNASTGAREMTLIGHTGSVNSVAFSPDGRHIVSGSWDKSIKVWNASTGALEKTVTRLEDHVHAVTFSPDGTRIISGSEDGTIPIWDASSGKQLLILDGHDGPVWDISVSTDGKRIASGGVDKTVRIWDAATGEALLTLRGHESSVPTVAFSPDGRRVVSGGKGGEIKIWDTGTGMELIDLYEDPTYYIRSAVFSPDGKSICVASDVGGIVLLESVEPVVGYEARRIANSASRLVDELYEKHELYQDVISTLRGDDTIVEAVRSKALQIANARLRRDIPTLSWQSWQVISSTDSNDVEYRKALETLERAVSYDSSRPWPFVFLGAAQYRVGAYEDALATLTRAKKISKKITDHLGVEPGLAIYYGTNPTIHAFSAMALHQLGRDKEANAILQQLRSGFERWFSAEDPLFGPPFRIRGPSLELIIEVERLFARGDSTLLSIWEHIEENRLDEASELIEKARQSKNADYVSRIEGAIKLIEALRNLK